MHGLRFRLRLLVVLRFFQFGIDPGQQVIDTDPGTAKATGGRPPVARHRRPQQEPEPGLPEGLREAMEKSEMRARDAAAGGPVGVDGTPVSAAPCSWRAHCAAGEAVGARCTPPGQIPGLAAANAAAVTR